MDGFDGIYVPGWKDEDATWTKASECILDAPGDMTHKFPIMARYKAAFSDDDVDFAMLASFFRDTMEISKCSWKDYVEEIKALKDKRSSDFDMIRQQYERLDKERGRMVTVEISTDAVR